MAKIIVPEADLLLDTKMSCLDKGWVIPVDYMGGDQRIVDAARISIAGENVKATASDEQLIRYLLRHKHTTPFEKVRFEFAVKAPIFVARQWIRHRMSSTNEMSARYGELPDDFYIPDFERFKVQSKDNKQGSGDYVGPTAALEMRTAFEEASAASYKVYKDMLDSGLARELARGVLPVNIYTQWYWTVDLWNLMHFLRLRLHSHAQYEIRVYAEQIYKFAKAVAPLAMTAFDDYLKNSVSLSRQEVELLEACLFEGVVNSSGIQDRTPEAIAKVLGSKREADEFLAKFESTDLFIKKEPAND